MQVFSDFIKFKAYWRFSMFLNKIPDMFPTLNNN